MNENLQMDAPLETHPFPPFIPQDARILIMGTFPPPEKRWSMDFYYPNRSNDFWYMMGLLFSGGKDALYDKAKKEFRIERIKDLLNDKGIALSDTGKVVRRLAGNASDKFLEIVRPVDIDILLDRMPGCAAISTTGQKAAETLAEITNSQTPDMGGKVTVPTSAFAPHLPPKDIDIWRMPSTSRAYPLPLHEKSEYYRRMFESVGIL